ncbi:hypothetical protein Z517_06772 [Fonsecaea pedrosoi CBS 271.37]|uniref:Unplaced genomic scaffold supercont1.4, whole genome shotgun sequence n=1 Tax=Fonsecaea pedrosoi CBS 271.37 TaxID=1442368 RepID=A0A0D2F0K6_9EURO|nr:uncharacterized protein Z517_06772 [Fonsecaea pedrosoi CBS 271.37]KIW80157.1 hypothetical protein Z517_06772 [Fonsecaea pedrosoi CBS 271.37]
MVRTFFRTARLAVVLSACLLVSAQADELDLSAPIEVLDSSPPIEELEISATTDSVSTQSVSFNGCSALSSAGLRSLLLYPSDPAYASREASYWSPIAALGPQCIIQPRSTADVSKVVKALARAKAKFAVRSGGHVLWAGGSDIKDGVTIDLGLMTAVTYNSQTKIVSIQPGPRWGDVYNTLAPLGVTVTGGRDAGVGIGGFLTGGGLSFLSGRNGLACDQVVRFEVVLADGRIVHADYTSNRDLWKALKGGWANYGIVTRFDVTSTPLTTAWGGFNLHDKSVGPQVTTALVNFINNLRQTPDNAHLALAAYNSFIPGETSIGTFAINTLGVENATALREILQVPAIARDLDFLTLGEIGEKFKDPSDDRVIWHTLTFNNDVNIANKALALHDELVARLKSTLGADKFNSQCVLQPLPSLFAEIGARQGGNVLGLDSVNRNSILWVGSVGFQNAAYQQAAHDAVSAYARNLESYAQSRNGNVAFRYINYADKDQNPLKSYGSTNVNFIKRVATKYDPTGVFQKQVPGSFKVSAI